MWNKKKTSHYVFNYHKGSLAERDIAKIAALQENCYEYICEVLKVKMARKIHYFLCESPEEVGMWYGSDEPINGVVKMPNKIYAVYSENVKCVGFHEDVHLISYNTMAKPKQTFIREGLAMFFDKVWWKIPNDAWVQVFITAKLYRKISTLTDNKEFHRYSDTITYPIAGAFVDYLISIFGIEKFKSFYKTVDENFDKCFLDVFDKALDHVEDKFISHIQSIKYDECIYGIINLYLKRDGLLK